MYPNNERNYTDHVYGKRHGETYHDASMRQGYEREMRLQQQEYYDKMNAQSNAGRTLSGGVSGDYPPIPATNLAKLIGLIGGLCIAASITFYYMDISARDIAFLGSYGFDNILLFITGCFFVAIYAFPPLLANLLCMIGLSIGMFAIIAWDAAFLLAALFFFGLGWLSIKLLVKKEVG